jgi:hypothetical protein
VIVAGPFVRGATLSLRAAVTVGDIANVSVLPTAKLKPVQAGKSAMPGQDVQSIASFTVTPAPIDGEVPAGWIITLTPVQTAALPTGTYVTDLRCVVAAGVQISAPVMFRLNDPVTS